MLRVRGPALVVLMCLVAAVVGCGSGGGAGDEEGAIAVVRAYLDARADGDARRACAQLTPGQRFELVARITGDFARASAGECERHVLSESTRSTATSPEDEVLRTAELDVRYRDLGPGLRAASVSRAGTESPFVEVIETESGWKVDGSAAEKVSFIYRCTAEGQAERLCECVFEEGVRRHDLDLYDEPAPPAEIRAVLSDAAARCAAADTKTRS